MRGTDESSRRRVLAEGRWLRLVTERGWEYVEHTRVQGVVLIIAFTPRRELVLVEQERIPLKRRVLEIPAGLVGDGAGPAEESFAEAARRELLEETGFLAESIEHLFDGPMSPGRTPDLYSFYLASGLRRVSAGGGDAFEQIRVHLMPIERADEWLSARRAEGLMIDPKIYIALYCAGKIRAD